MNRPAISVSVDGRPVEVAEGSTVLDACREAGAEVTTLCHDDRVHSGGHCRACLVEVSGRALAACTALARPGQVILTDSPRLRRYREDLGELMWSESRPSGEAAAAVARWGASGARYPVRRHHERRDTSHPYLRLDLSTCIRCRLCMRACDAVQGQHVFAFGGRGADTHLLWGDRPFADTDCVACGACASLCPTGALSDVDRLRAAAADQTAVTRTTCGFCGVGCQLEVHVGVERQAVHDDVNRVNRATPTPRPDPLSHPTSDRVLRVDGVADASVNRGHLCVKGRYAHAFTRHPERLTTPLIRRDGALRQASWDEALSFVADGFRQILAAGHQVGGLSSSRCTNEENYLLQKWMRAGLGTHNVDCCARVCHAPTAAGMRRSFGTGAATNSLADLERADCILVAGSNSTEAHPVTGARIRQAVLQRRASLIVIDPRRTELARLADVHLMLRPGTNVPLLNALAHCLIALDLVDHAFIAARTEGYDALRAALAASSPERTEVVTGVAPSLVWQAAALYGRAERPLQTHGLGMTEHYQGSESVMQLCNLALLVGGVGREGVGVNPLRGQNNVQGAADMGCQPDALTGYLLPTDPAVQAHIARIWGAPLPNAAGLTLPRMYDAARAGNLRGLFIMGEDVVQTDPASHVRDALDSLELLVVQELFLSETAKRAHVVLPGASFLEKDGTFTNGERRIQRVRRALAPPPGAREDWRILCDLMTRSGLPQCFESPSEIMDEIARVAPSFAGVSYPRLEPDGLQWPVPDPTHPGTPRLHGAGFPLGTEGRARFAVVEHLASPSLLSLSEEDWPLRLVTGRVLAHYNCGSMTRRSDNAALVPGDALELCAADALRFGLDDGDDLFITSPWGEARAPLRVSERIAEGTAFLTFHFPETGTNELMSPVLDRLAECPEYKVTPIRVRRA